MLPNPVIMPTADFAVDDGGGTGVVSPDPPELPQAASESDNISVMPTGAKVILCFVARFSIVILPSKI
jgi:hypothetical protein